MSKLQFLKQYRKEHVKALYGKMGRGSGINPGVLYPRKEELEHLKQYEAAFCPKLEDLIAENRAKKEEALRVRKQREDEVLRNLQRLPEEFKSFFDKLEERDNEKKQWLEEREALIEEVREILGFRAKPTDERFQQALQQKEEEDAKARRKALKKAKENASLTDILGAAPGEVEISTKGRGKK